MAAFITLALAVSWSWWTIAYTVIGDGELSNLLILPGGFGPAIAAGVVTRASGRSVRAWASQVVRWRVFPRWYLLAIGLPIAITVSGISGALVLVGGPLDPTLVRRRLPLFVASLLLAALVGGGQEELGWRGFALPRLQVSHSALTSSVVIGVVWATWHLPLFLMGTPRNQTGNVPLYAGLVIAFSVLLTWCYNSTGGSVLLAMLFHGAMNASGSLAPVPLSAISRVAAPIDVGVTLVVSVVALAVVAWKGPSKLSHRQKVVSGVSGSRQATPRGPSDSGSPTPADPGRPDA